MAALFGPRSANSGFGIIVTTLPPGTYDIVVYAHSALARAFVVAQTVRVTVRSP